LLSSLYRHQAAEFTGKLSPKNLIQYESYPDSRLRKLILYSILPDSSIKMRQDQKSFSSIDAEACRDGNHIEGDK
jgi:hypothetical protein